MLLLCPSLSHSHNYRLVDPLFLWGTRGGHMEHPLPQVCAQQGFAPVGTGVLPGCHKAPLLNLELPLPPLQRLVLREHCPQLLLFPGLPS